MVSAIGASSTAAVVVVGMDIAVSCSRSQNGTFLMHKQPAGLCNKYTSIYTCTNNHRYFSPTALWLYVLFNCIPSAGLFGFVGYLSNNRFFMALTIQTTFLTIKCYSLSMLFIELFVKFNHHHSFRELIRSQDNLDTKLCCIHIDW